MPRQQPEPAYLVPFTVEVEGGRVRIANASDETLHWVRVTASAPHTPLARGTMELGQVVELQLSEGAARSGHLHFAWLRVTDLGRTCGGSSS